MLTSALEVNGINGDKSIGRTIQNLMSRHQCCVWGCHNGKGRCPENIKGERICGCPDLRSTGCPKSRELLSLHYIQKMPDQVKKPTVSKINKTRQSSGGGLWVPSDKSCICNMHYEDFKGPVGGKSIWCLGTSNDPMSLTTKDQLREGS